MYTRKNIWMIATTALVIGMGSFIWTGCSKTGPVGPSVSTDTDPGTPKAPYYVFAIANGTAPMQFNVTRGLDPSYGIVIRNGGLRQRSRVDLFGASLYSCPISRNK